MTEWSLFSVLLLLVSYLLGTFPTAQLVAGQRGVDPTTTGSGNPGATNVYRTTGFRAGLVVFVGDVGKGALASGLGWVLVSRWWGLLCWFVSVLGHVLPAVRRFRGGKGVATAAGGVWVLFPFVAAVNMVFFFLLVRVTRTASLGSIFMALATPSLIALSGYRKEEVFLAVAISVLVLVRHQGNIRRLVSGSESSWRSTTRRHSGDQHDGSNG